MVFQRDAITSDFAAFADDKDDVIIDRQGDLLYRHFGKDIVCKLSEGSDGLLLVDDGTGPLPYRDYLTHKLGRLDVFAEKLLAERHPDPFFVNGPARLESISSKNRSAAVLELLNEQCSTVSPFSARLVFITADAGHGKTALMRQFQYQAADGFLKGHTHTLFWHVDLQGRQLVRLSEALMGDLGELRMTGLFMPSILTLIRHRLLVLGIDGFDELAAEQGTSDALGALRVLLDQMDGRGVIVAASRRTFFNSESYARRTSLVTPGSTSKLCEFNEIRLKPWSRTEVVEYFGKVQYERSRFESADATYEQIQSELGGDNSHPMLTTPFLISHVAKGILLYDTTPRKFVRGMVDPVRGVPAVVEEFVKREVTDKWKSKDTGEPYLSVSQHLTLLTNISEEMWNSQVDRLSTDVVEAVAALLLEEWNINPDRRRQIHDMIRMHVLLQRPLDSRDDVRCFEHPEFRNYFTSLALCSLLREVAAVESQPGTERLARFLSIGQLPDSVARYASTLLEKDKLPIGRLVDHLCDIVNQEWRPTYLAINIGTIIPWLLDGVEPLRTIRVHGRTIVFSSVVFQKTKLRNVQFVETKFVQTPFVDVDWKDVTFERCHCAEVSFDRGAHYDNVLFASCTFDGVALIVDGKEVDRAYSLSRALQIAEKAGVQLADSSEASSEPDSRTEKNKLVSRLLRAFRRTNGLTERVIRLKFPSDNAYCVLDEIIPLMKRHDLIKEVPWKGKGRPQKIWMLTRGVDDILRGDGGDADAELVRFWQEVNSREGSKR